MYFFSQARRPSNLEYWGIPVAEQETDGKPERKEFRNNLETDKGDAQCPNVVQVQLSQLNRKEELKKLRKLDTENYHVLNVADIVRQLELTSHMNKRVLTTANMYAHSEIDNATINNQCNVEMRVNNNDSRETLLKSDAMKIESLSEHSFQIFDSNVLEKLDLQTESQESIVTEINVRVDNIGVDTHVNDEHKVSSESNASHIDDISDYESDAQFNDESIYMSTEQTDNNEGPVNNDCMNLPSIVEVYIDVDCVLDDVHIEPNEQSSVPKAKLLSPDSAYDTENSDQSCFEDITDRLEDSNVASYSLDTFGSDLCKQKYSNETVCIIADTVESVELIKNGNAERCYRDIKKADEQMCRKSKKYTSNESKDRMTNPISVTGKQSTCSDLDTNRRGGSKEYLNTNEPSNNLIKKIKKHKHDRRKPDCSKLKEKVQFRGNKDKKVHDIEAMPTHKEHVCTKGNANQKQNSTSHVIKNSRKKESHKTDNELEKADCLPKLGLLFDKKMYDGNMSGNSKSLHKKRRINETSESNRRNIFEESRTPTDYTYLSHNKNNTSTMKCETNRREQKHAQWKQRVSHSKQRSKDDPKQVIHTEKHTKRENNKKVVHDNKYTKNESKQHVSETTLPETKAATVLHETKATGIHYAHKDRFEGWENKTNFRETKHIKTKMHIRSTTEIRNSLDLSKKRKENSISSNHEELANDEMHTSNLHQFHPAKWKRTFSSGHTQPLKNKYQDILLQRENSNRENSETERHAYKQIKQNRERFTSKTNSNNVDCASAYLHEHEACDNEPREKSECTDQMKREKKRKIHKLSNASLMEISAKKRVLKWLAAQDDSEDSDDKVPIDNIFTSMNRLKFKIPKLVNVIQKAGALHTFEHCENTTLSKELLQKHVETHSRKPEVSRRLNSSTPNTRKLVSQSTFSIQPISETIAVSEIAKRGVVDEVKDYDGQSNNKHDSEYVSKWKSQKKNKHSNNDGSDAMETTITMQKLIHEKSEPKICLRRIDAQSKLNNNFVQNKCPTTNGLKSMDTVSEAVVVYKKDTRVERNVNTIISGNEFVPKLDTQSELDHTFVQSKCLTTHGLKSKYTVPEALVASKKDTLVMPNANKLTTENNTKTDSLNHESHVRAKPDESRRMHMCEICKRECCRDKRELIRHKYRKPSESNDRHSINRRVEHISSRHRDKRLHTDKPVHSGRHRNNVAETSDRKCVPTCSRSDESGGETSEHNNVTAVHINPMMSGRLDTLVGNKIDTSLMQLHAKGGDKSKTTQMCTICNKVYFSKSMQRHLDVAHSEVTNTHVLDSKTIHNVNVKYKTEEHQLHERIIENNKVTVTFDSESENENNKKYCEGATNTKLENENDNNEHREEHPTQKENASTELGTSYSDQTIAKIAGVNEFNATKDQRPTDRVINQNNTQYRSEHFGSSRWHSSHKQTSGLKADMNKTGNRIFPSSRNKIFRCWICRRCKKGFQLKCHLKEHIHVADHHMNTYNYRFR